MRRLKKRFQFLNAARGERISGRFFVLQRVRVEQEDFGVGFTVTKRMGNSAERNRIKRRLRAAVMACKGCFADRHDYVLIGKREVLNAPFAELVQRLGSTLQRMERRPPPADRSASPNS